MCQLKFHIRSNQIIEEFTRNMGNIEMKEEAITTLQECYHCKGAGYVIPKFSRKYLDQDLSPTQKRERDQCLDCLGKGHLTLEHYDEKNFTL